MAAAIPMPIIWHLQFPVVLIRHHPYGTVIESPWSREARDGTPAGSGSYLCLEVGSLKYGARVPWTVCDPSRPYGLPGPTRAASRSATFLIFSRNGVSFDRSERLRSSKYDTKPTISLTMSSTVCAFRPGMPNGHSISSFAFGESSYRPSSRFRSRSSCVICSSRGYTDPGDGRHQPCVIVSISSMISAPFFGALARIETIQPRRPRFRCIIQRNGGNMGSEFSYRITDIYPFRRESVFRYRKSDIRKYRPRYRRRGDKPWPACKGTRITIGIVG